jgi:hypothetical protein
MRCLSDLAKKADDYMFGKCHIWIIRTKVTYIKLSSIGSFWQHCISA